MFMAHIFRGKLRSFCCCQTSFLCNSGNAFLLLVVIDADPWSVRTAVDCMHVELGAYCLNRSPSCLLTSLLQNNSSSCLRWVIRSSLYVMLTSMPDRFLNKTVDALPTIHWSPFPKQRFNNSLQRLYVPLDTPSSLRRHCTWRLGAPPSFLFTILRRFATQLL